MTRIGLVARATRSGLGYLCRSFDDGMRVHERLVITDCDPRYRDHIDWYEGRKATFVRWADMEKFPFERFLGEIDVLFSYEIFYSKKLLRTAKQMGVRTVLMGMPELTRRAGHNGFIGDPDEYVWPTNWRRHPSERHLPVPTDPPEIDMPTERKFDGLSVVHVAGARAIGDRNGTDLFLDALQYIRSQVYVRICVNDRFNPMVTVPDNVVVEIRRNTTDRWTMYEGMDVLCLPRRYGGLSLPVQEAASCGLAILLPDCEPNREYPAQVMKCQPGRPQRVPIGQVPTFVTRPAEIAHMIDTLAMNHDVLRHAKQDSFTWGLAHAWHNLRPWYEEVLCSSTP